MVDVAFVRVWVGGIWKTILHYIWFISPRKTEITSTQVPHEHSTPDANHAYSAVLSLDPEYIVTFDAPHIVNARVRAENYVAAMRSQLNTAAACVQYTYKYLYVPTPMRVHVVFVCGWWGGSINFTDRVMAYYYY